MRIAPVFAASGALALVTLVTSFGAIGIARAGVDLRPASSVACATVAACVIGKNTATGPGVGGTSKSGPGVLAASQSGAGLSATSTSGSGVFGESSSLFGVEGVTLKNATSASNARSGVLGEDLSTNKTKLNNGVAGTSAHGTGVFGQGGSYGGYFATTTSNGFGLFAQGAKINGPTSLITGDGDGLHVTPDGGITGTYGGSTTIVAFANGVAGGAGDFTDNFFVGTQCVSDPDFPTPSCSDTVSIDGDGNAIFAGTVTQNGSALFRTHTHSGSDVAAFSDRMAAPSIEDLGKAQLHGGSSYVALDRTFASAIDSRSQYLVFVTPEGNSNGLYATSLTQAGFYVRENNGGRSSLTFNYRIVAKPLDARATHLPAMSVFPQLHKHRPVPPRTETARAL